MTTRNPDVAREHLGRFARFAWRSMMMDIWTSLPGLIDRYDPETKRADIEPALDLVMSDGSGSRARQLVVDVPVIWPAPSGFVIQGPLDRGEPVLLLAAARDITAFKASFRRSVPGDPRLFSLIDSIAIAGFGEREITVPSGRGSAITVQTDDGETYIALEPDRIELRAGGSYITITPSDILISAPHVGLDDDR